MYLLVCAVVFIAAYLLNSLYMTVFYHRALCHSAVTLSPRLRRFVVATGNWVTSLDPKGWVCMHRMHHEYSDTADDPHSPSNSSILGVFRAQHKSYERVLVGLYRKDPRFTEHVKDLDFPVHWLNTKRMWLLPLGVHFSVGLAAALVWGMPLLGACYFFGLMCHPIQGWLVNSFGHAHGPRNFDTPDDSRNNAFVAWLIVGEGLQNNHHAHPASAKFSYAPGEFDLGYWFCRGLQRLGGLEINQKTLIPVYGSAPPPMLTAPSAAPRKRDAA
jgi:stearoyl-CoA desaturase (delta-9 desaturase)